MRFLQKDNQLQNDCHSHPFRQRFLILDAPWRVKVPPLHFSGNTKDAHWVSGAVVSIVDFASENKKVSD